MMQPFAFRISLVALFWVPSVALSADLNLTQRAQAIFEAKCAKCHGQNKDDREAELNLLDLNQIRTGSGESRKPLLDSGTPENSLLYQQIVGNKMPKGRSNPKLTPEEKSVILEWIRSETPSRVAPAQTVRGVTSLGQIDQIIKSDLSRFTGEQQKNIRYLTLTNILSRSGPAISDSVMESYRQALSKLMNSLSWVKQIYRLESVDTGKTIFRVWLPSYSWTPELWNSLIQFYPYGVKSNTADYQYNVNATGSQIYAIRGDWLAARGAKGSLYNFLLRLPDTDKKLEDILGINVSNNISNGSVWRAGVHGGDFPGGSGVSDHNRLIERHETGYGAYWKSYDFNSSEDKQDLFSLPLGPGGGAFGFVHGGGEIIFNLPNGLQAYFVADGRGNVIDVAPQNIVRDKTNGNKQVFNGLSCISCHSTGMNHADDQVLAHVLEAPNAFQPVLEKLKNIYPKKAIMDSYFDQDDARFAAALRDSGVTTLKEPVSALAQDFEAPVTLQKAAAEMGLSITEFNQKLSQQNRLEQINANIRSGATRDKFITTFQDLVRIFNLGAPFGFNNPVLRAAAGAGAQVADPQQQSFRLTFRKIESFSKVEHEVIGRIGTVGIIAYSRQAAEEKALARARNSTSEFIQYVTDYRYGHSGPLFAQEFDETVTQDRKDEFVLGDPLRSFWPEANSQPFVGAFQREVNRPGYAENSFHFAPSGRRAVFYTPNYSGIGEKIFLLSEIQSYALMCRKLIYDCRVGDGAFETNARWRGSFSADSSGRIRLL